MEKPNTKPGQKQEELVRLVRILSKDIRGDKKLHHGLCDIDGISWMISNAICRISKVDKNKLIQDLTSEEIKLIEETILRADNMPVFLKNRRRDVDDGTDKHIAGTDLSLQIDFDIKRMKKMKSYKGVRHTLGQPVRGQRTKSHFRKNKKKSGVGSKSTKAGETGGKK